MSGKFAGLELDVETPQRMTIVHPVTLQALKGPEGEEAYIDVFSDDSEVCRKHQRAVARRRFASRGRGRITPEEIEGDAVNLLAALTAGWHLVGLDGKLIDVAFSPDAAKELYESPALAWLRSQVDSFVSDRANFTKASSTT